MYKRFKPEDIQYVQQNVSAKITLDGNSGGVKTTTYHSESLNEHTKSYYNSINQLFYKRHDHGGNSVFTGRGVYYSYSEDRYDKKQFKNKFPDKGVMFSISSSKYGRSIKPGTFNLTDTSTGSINIIDDGNGNLYPTNATLSQSGVTSISSSDNYVGNIFYEHGIAVITETGSWSAGCHYTSSGQSYAMSFNNMKTIDTLKFKCEIEPSEFNMTMNPTILSSSNAISRSSFNDSRQYGNFSYEGDGGLLGNPAYYQSGSITNITDGTIKPIYRKNEFTTYITTLGFYNEHNELMMVAKFPQPVKKIKDQTMTIFVEMDF